MIAKTLVFLSCLFSVPGLAQGRIIWPNVEKKLKAYSVRVSPTRYKVYFPGWMTLSGGNSLAQDEYVAVGTGRDFHSVPPENFTDCEVEDDEDGEAMDGGSEAGELFPFDPNPNVAKVVKAKFEQKFKKNRMAWEGFLAKVTQAVPARRGGTLCLTMTTLAGDGFLYLQCRMIRFVLGYYIADSRGTAKSEPVFLQFENNPIPPELSEAGILHYKFDRGAGDFAVNHAEGFGAAPPTGTMVSNSTVWAPAGKFKAALHGGDNSAPGQVHCYCDTCWNGSLYGSFTVAWFMKQRNNPGTALSNFFSGIRGFQCFTNGRLGTTRHKGLQVWNHDGQAGRLSLDTDVQKTAANQWLHVALVVDHYQTGKTRAFWYLGGKKVKQIDSIQPANLMPEKGATFRIGAHKSLLTPSVYDIDEFRFDNTAVDEGTIKSWSVRSTAAVNPFGHAGCGCYLSHNGGLPTLGNRSFQLFVVGPANSGYCLVLGDGAKLGSVLLPIDLGNGCFWYSNFLVQLPPGVTGTQGLDRVSLPIPLDPIYAGLNLYNQAVMWTARLEILVSNAHAVAIEK